MRKFRKQVEPRAAIVLGTLVVGAVVLAASCSDNAEIVTPPGTGGGGTGGAQVGGAGQGGDIFTGGGTPGCTKDDECNGGVCVEGTCCPSQDLVCGSTCCTTGDVCLFDACVTPGDDCLTEADCPDGHYCDPALGEGGQGGSGQGGGNCTQPIIPGKCVPKPPICTGDPTDPPNCIENCEYFPPVGQLNATIQWQWGYDPVPTEVSDKPDVWATPAVARIYDANCDGKVDLADPPNVIFVSGNSNATFCCASGSQACRQGVLRVLDGRSGEELWSLETPESGSVGFAALSVAVGDVDQDQVLDIVALSGEGKVVVVSNTGVVKHVSSDLVVGNNDSCFGWGGAVSLGDMDNDGWPEIAFGASVFTMAGGTLAPLFNGTAGQGDIAQRRMSHFVDLDNDGDLELLAGNSAYQTDGSVLWTSAAADGFTATGDFDGDSLPEVVMVRNGNVWVLEGATGAIELGPVSIPGTGNGGPPTVANFDGLPGIEIGVAMQNLYSVLKPNYQTMTIDTVWSQTNHDASSSVTGSSVFDFEGDGKAEVIYNDECFVWVYDGATGDVLFTANTQSFTATEATIVADLDGDGHAEILMGANGANPNNWHCAHHDGSDGIYPAWSLPPNAPAYRGVTAFADVANSWVGTRTLWNQHAYSVTNVCDPRDGACLPGSYYGQIPSSQQKNWQLPWLNNFRQNVQDAGLFDAPDVVLSLSAQCASPVPLKIQVRNQGLAGLPAGIEIGIFRIGNPDQLITSLFTPNPLLPGQTAVLLFDVPPASGGTADTYQARVIIDPNNVTFHECREDNNESPAVRPECVQ
ncbi:MAG: hypothetical protein KC731_14145 [Myxococcales bacterium]|nr:hypothetical protein [Myxococcales bacterium]